MMGYLLDRGTDVNKIEWSHSDGDSRFNTSAGQGYGAALHVAARDGDEARLLLLLSRRADRNIYDTLGRMALKVADDAGNDGIIAILCNRDAV